MSILEEFTSLPLPQKKKKRKKRTSSPYDKMLPKIFLILYMYYLLYITLCVKILFHKSYVHKHLLF